MSPSWNCWRGLAEDVLTWLKRLGGPLKHLGHHFEGLAATTRL